MRRCTLWASHFELEQTLRACQGGQQGWSSLCWFCKNQHRQANQGCTDPSGGHPSPPTGSVDQAAHIARTCRPIANAIEPPCKPGCLKPWSLLFCTRVPWRLAQEACACMHRPAHGRCITPRTYQPSADAEEPMAEPYWATCPARACMRVCTVFLCAQRMLHSSGMHKQGVFASKASPSSVLINWDRLSLVLRSSFKPRRRRTKHSLCAFWR